MAECETATESHARLRTCPAHRGVVRVCVTVSALVEALEPAMVVDAFQCSTFTSAADFLRTMATRMGKYIKGGAPNELSAARQLIRRWNAGQVPYYVYPPEVEEGGAVVEGLGRMFEQENAKAVLALRAKEEAEGERKYIVLDDSLFAADEDDEQGGDEDEEDDHEGDVDQIDGYEHQHMEEEEEEEEGEEEADDDKEDDAMEAAGEDELKQPVPPAERRPEEKVDDDDDDEEDEIFLNPSPARTRTRHARQLSVDTAKGKGQAAPTLTPSKAQQRLQERQERERRGEKGNERVAMDEEEQVSEPDSPAKHTRSHDAKVPTSAPEQSPARRTRQRKAAAQVADNRTTDAPLSSGERQLPRTARKAKSKR